MATKKELFSAEIKIDVSKTIKDAIKAIDELQAVIEKGTLSAKVGISLLKQEFDKLPKDIRKSLNEVDKELNKIAKRKTPTGDAVGAAALKASTILTGAEAMGLSQKAMYQEGQIHAKNFRKGLQDGLLAESSAKQINLIQALGTDDRAAIEAARNSLGQIVGSLKPYEQTFNRAFDTSALGNYVDEFGRMDIAITSMLRSLPEKTNPMSMALKKVYSEAVAARDKLVGEGAGVNAIAAADRDIVGLGEQITKEYKAQLETSLKIHGARQNVYQDEIKIAALQQKAVEAAAENKAFASQNLFTNKGLAGGIGGALDEIKNLPARMTEIANQGGSMWDRFIGGVRIAADATTQLRSSFNNVQAGFQIMSAGADDTGKKMDSLLLGVRRVIFGTAPLSDVTNKWVSPLAKGLDFAIGKFVNMSRATTQLNQELANLAGDAARVNREAKVMLDPLKLAAPQASSQIRDLNEHLAKSANQYQRIQTTIEAGNKVTQQDITAYKAGVAAIQEYITNIEKIAPELKEALVPLRQVAEYNQDISRTITTGIQNQGLTKTYKDTARAALGVLNPINLIKRATQQTGDELQKDTLYMRDFNRESKSAAETAQQIGGTFKQIFTTAIGVMGGNLLTNAVQKVVGNISGFFRSLKGEFFSANNLVQNFEVTLRQIMSGYAPEVIEKSMQGANELIRKVIAKTPFELATGQQAFQKLVIGGFDPRAWLEPAADAAAAFNKPMEQLIGGMQRLKAGSKGMGVDMIRDFGIPVQQVGRWVDKTGQNMDKSLLFDEKGIKRTDEQLKAMGNTWEQWKFNAAGSLEQMPTEALDILNGYLQQNATTAGASAARSRTLTGVMSNMNDALTTLMTTAGQPIFAAMTDGLMAVQQIIDKIMVVATPFAHLLGIKLKLAFDNLVGPMTEERLTGIANTLLGVLEPAMNVILLLVDGEWSRAWGVFLNAAENALINVADFITAYGSDAITWGANFVGNIASGIMSAANSVLVSAVSYVGSVISSFLEPHSPPEKGPLSTIDKWGEPLANLYGDGFKKFDASKISDALSPIKEEFQLLGKENFGDVEDTFKKLTDIYNQTGKIDENAMAQLTGLVGVSKATGLRDKLTGKTTGGAAATPEKVAASKAKAAKEGSNAVAKGAEKEIETIQGRYEKEMSLLEARKKEGLISESEYASERLRIEQQYYDSLSKSSNESERAMAKDRLGILKEYQTAAIEEQAKAEQALLARRLKDGIITDKEFASQQASLETKKYEAMIQSAGEYSDAQISAQADVVKNWKSQAEALGKTTQEMPQAVSANEIMAAMSEDVTGEFETKVEAMQANIANAITSSWDEVTTKFNQKFTPIFDQIKRGLFGDDRPQTDGWMNSLGLQDQTTEQAPTNMFDKMSAGINKAWEETIKPGLKTKIEDMWTWLGSEEGPLSKGAGVITQMADSFDKWVAENGPRIELMTNNLASVIGNSLMVSFTGLFGGESTEAQSYMYTIWSGLERILMGVASLGESAMAGVLGQTLASSFSAPLKVAIAGIFVALSPREKLIEVWNQWSYNLGLLKDNFMFIIEEIVTGTTTTFQDKLIAGMAIAGAGIVAALILPFKNAYDLIIGHSIVPDLVNDTIDYFEKTDWKGVGQNILKGIKKGMLDYKERLFSEIENIANDALGAFKKILGIESPSKAFAELGMYSMQGFGDGITSSLGYIEKAMSQFQGTVSEGMDFGDLGVQVATNLFEGTKLSFEKVLSGSDVVRDMAWNFMQNSIAMGEGKALHGNELKHARSNFAKFEGGDRASQQALEFLQSGAVLTKEKAIEMYTTIANKDFNSLKYALAPQANKEDVPKIAANKMFDAMKQLLVEFNNNLKTTVKTQTQTALSSLDTITDFQDNVLKSVGTQVSALKDASGRARDIVAATFERQFLGNDIYQLNPSDYSGELAQSIRIAQAAQAKFNGSLSEQAALQNEMASTADYRNAIEQYRSLFPEAGGTDNSMFGGQSPLDVIAATNQQLIDSVTNLGSFLATSQALNPATIPSGANVSSINASFTTNVNNPMDAAMLEQQIIQILGV